MATKAIRWTESDMIDAACEHWGEGFEPGDCRVIRSTRAGDRPCLVVLHEPTGRTSDEAGDAGRWETDGRACTAD
jgi:hypothetical protein